MVLSNLLREVQIFLFLFIVILANKAQEPKLGWVRGIGSMQADEGKSVATDNDGNVYVLGGFLGTIDFDPEADTCLLDGGTTGIFIIKYNKKGKFQWAKAIGGNCSKKGNAIATDEDGSIYVTGYYKDSVDIDPGGDIKLLHSKVAGSAIFILKLDTYGDYQWATTIDASGSAEGSFINADKASNIYITGFFNNSADFDPGTGIEELISIGSEDIFILKLNTDGEYQWVKSIYTDEGPNNIYCNSATIDSWGNIYLTGALYGTADFDPGIGTKIKSAFGQDDIFVLKLDNNGNYQWAEVMGGNSYDAGRSIVADKDGNAYVTGNFEYIAYFKLEKGTKELTSLGSYDIFISKFNDKGIIQWVKAIGGTSRDEGKAITLDYENNLCLTGLYNGSVDFDPGTAVYKMEALGNSDIFILKLDTEGDFKKSMSIGGNGDDIGNSISADIGNNLYLTGSFNSTFDYDIGTTSYKLISAGASDIVTLKVSQCNIDIQVSQVGNTYVANADGMEKYIWLDANNNKVLCSINEFTPVDNGKYILYIENFGCYAFSDTITVNTLGINNNLFDKEIIIYPNPTTGNLKISFGKLHNQVLYNVRNIAGEVIQHGSAENTQFVSFDIIGNKGVYIVEMLLEEQVTVFKVIIL